MKKQKAKILVWKKSRNKKNKKQMSIISVSIRILVPAFILFIIMIGASYSSILNAEKLAHQYISDTAMLYVDAINSDLKKIISEIFQIYKNDSMIDELPREVRADTTQHYSLYKKIVEQNQRLRLRYGSQYQFYVYDSETDLLILDTSIFLKEGYQTDLSTQFKESLTDIGSDQWHCIEINEHNYMYCAYSKENSIIGCFVDLDALLEKLELSNMGYETVPYIVRKDGSVIVNRHYKENYDVPWLVQKSQSGSIFQKSYSNYSFALKSVGDIRLLILSTNGILANIFKQQTLLIFLTISIVLGGGLAGFYYFKKILAPMKQFVRNLKKPNEDQLIHNNENNNIIELEIASKEFRNLLKEIKSLKIEVYEKELLWKNTQLEYLKAQVRPHFYLNCLSIISGMAEKENEQDIVGIVDVLSKYMRYVIRDSFQLRRVWEEVNHIENYIQIQKLRYKDAFTFDVSLQNEAEGCYLPALLLQVFVENAVKHAVSLDKVIDVSLYITSETIGEEKYLYISVSDTGKGFPKEVLEDIENGKAIYYDGRKHIGIENTIQRLRILYGDRAKISFSNMDTEFGAVVEIILPFSKVNQEYGKEMDI